MDVIPQFCCSAFLRLLGVIYFSGGAILVMSKQMDVSQQGERVPAVPDAAPSVPWKNQDMFKSQTWKLKTEHLESSIFSFLEILYGLGN
jgi:hypothetical protein